MFLIMLQNVKFNFNFIKNSRITLFISALFIVLSIFSFFYKGLNFGIDFTGGLLFDINLTENIKNNKLLIENLEKSDFEDFILQNYDENGLMLRITQKDVLRLEKENKDEKEIRKILKETFNKKIEYKKIEFVGPQVGDLLIKNGILALIISFVGILFYIWIRFKVEFGIAAIISLIHDIIILMGFISFFSIEFSLTSIAAVLTIIGYSINDTVVIFDRIREYFEKYKKDSFEKIIDLSLNSTLRRTILTGVSVFLVLIPLILIGGEVLFNFGIIIFLGTIIGTYSSIFVAAPFLILLRKDN